MASLEKEAEKLSKYAGVAKNDYSTINELLDKAEANISKLNDAEKEKVARLIQQIRFLQNIDVLENHRSELRKQEIKDLENKAKNEKDSLKRLEAQLALAKLVYEQTKKDATEKSKLSKDQQEKLEENLKLQHDKIKQLEKETETIITSNKKLEETNVKMVALVSAAFRLGDALSAGFTSKLLEPIFNPLSFISSKILEIVNREKDFVSATGQMSADMSADLIGLSEDFSDVREQYAKFGVTNALAAKSYAELFNSMKTFTSLTAAERDQMSRHTTAMKNFGISAEAVGKNYDILSKSLKITGKDAMEFSDRLMRHAQAAGIAPRKMVEEFAAAAPKIVAYGKRAEEVYINLQKQAKSLGMEMSTLMGIVGDVFDTFEGSARAAGKLNAILGGNYLNSIEMLNASEDERIMLLKQSMDASGRQFDQLGKYEQKAIAASLGISDLSVAQSILGTSTKEVESEMNKQMSSQDKLTKALAASADPMNKLNEVLGKLEKNLSPLAEKLNKFLEVLTDPEKRKGLNFLTKWVVEHIDTILEWGMRIAALKTIIVPFFSLIGVGGGIFKGFGLAIKGVLNLLTGFVSWIGKAASSIFSSSNKVANSTTKMGTAARTSWPQILALGAAVALMGVGVGAAAYGFSLLVNSFKGLNGKQVTGAVIAIVGVVIVMIFAINALSASIGALGTVSGISAPFIFAVGAAILALGGGIYLALNGIGVIIEKFYGGVSKIFHEIGNIVKEFGIAAANAGWGTGAFVQSIKDLFPLLTFANIASLWEFSKALYEIGYSTKNFPNLATNIQSFKASIDSLETDKLVKFSNVFYNMNNILWSANTAKSSTDFNSSISSITKSLESLPKVSDDVIKKIQSLGAATASTKQFFLSLEDSIKILDKTSQMIEFTNQLERIAKAVNDISAMDKTAMAKTFNAIFGIFDGVNKEPAVTKLISSIGDVQKSLEKPINTSSFVLAIEQITSEIDKIGSAIDKIPTSKKISIEASFINPLNNNIVTATPTAIETASAKAAIQELTVKITSDELTKAIQNSSESIVKELKDLKNQKENITVVLENKGGTSSGNSLSELKVNRVIYGPT